MNSLKSYSDSVLNYFLQISTHLLFTYINGVPKIVTKPKYLPALTVANSQKHIVNAIGSNVLAISIDFKLNKILKHSYKTHLIVILF